VPGYRSINAHSSEQHRAAVFSGIYQHLDGKPPLREIMF
jgi:hypothetical protein